MLRVERVVAGDADELPHQSGTSDGEYRLLQDGVVRWTVRIDFGDAGHVPFREEVVWESAGVAAIGGGDRVHLLDLETGAPLREVEVPSFFGHLALATPSACDRDELLLVLGWADVHAIGRDLSIRWIARGVAVDGITFDQANQGTLVVSAEMDPPGGWFTVTLDARDGRELERHPAFTSGHDDDDLSGSGGEA